MLETAQSGLLHAALVARDTPLQQAPNGVRYASFGEITLPSADLDRMVQAVPRTIAAALTGSAYYFVPLALGERPSLAPPDLASTGARDPNQQTLIASQYSTDFSDQAVCHRNVRLGTGSASFDGVFISTRLLGDRFALAFEFFINVGHAFVDTAGVPERFATLAWSQALADVRGETSQDAWESRNLALAGTRKEAILEPKPEGVLGPKSQVDEKARLSFVEAAFSDAVAIYQLSLAVDFDYAELREREYPLLAPQALAERLRLIASLFPPNPGYEFAIRYRRRP
jgi:hypothetical protein